MIRWQAGMATVTDAQIAAAAPIVVAVLDTGVFAGHQDLKNVMWQNSAGAVGYDATASKTIARAESTDGNGHGSHVAGIIAGEGRNAHGIHGVGFLPRPAGGIATSITEIMNIRVLNANGAGTSDMITKGLKWAVDQHWAQKAADATRTKQKMIINMSLGGPFEAGDYSFKKDGAGKYVFEDDLINWATSKGDVLVVVAAGNESCGISGDCELYGQSFKETYYYPCSY
jgi:subtilisin family serine protease